MLRTVSGMGTGEKTDGQTTMISVAHLKLLALQLLPSADHFYFAVCLKSELTFKSVDLFPVSLLQFFDLLQMGSM